KLREIGDQIKREQLEKELRMREDIKQKIRKERENVFKKQENQPITPVVVRESEEKNNQLITPLVVNREEPVIEEKEPVDLFEPGKHDFPPDYEKNENYLKPEELEEMKKTLKTHKNQVKKINERLKKYDDINDNQVK